MLQGLLLSLFSGAAYGMMGILAKLAYAEGMAVREVLLCRFAFGAVFMLAYVLLRNPRLLRIKPRTAGKVALMGMVLFCGQSAMFFSALTYIPASTAVLILYGYPATVTLLSVFVFKMRIDTVVALSLAAVTGGLCLVFYDAFARELHMVGILLALGALVSMTLYLVLSQLVLRDENALGVVFYLLLFTCLGFSFIQNPLSLFELQGKRLLLAAGLGLIPTALAISALFLAIERIGSAYASIFSSVEPLATMVAAHFILDESIVAWQIFGAALIIGGIALPNLHDAQQKYRKFKLLRIQEPLP